MNKLLEEKQEQIDKIASCDLEYLNIYKNYLKQKKLVGLDKNAGLIKKMILKSNLKKRYKEQRLELKEKRKSLTDINDSKLIFYVGTNWELLSLEAIDDPYKGQGPETVGTVNYYYSYDKDKFYCILGIDDPDKREKIENEIDVSLHFKKYGNVLGEISEENRKEIGKKLTKFVDEAILEKDPQTWEELRKIVNRRFHYKKENLKKVEDKSIAQ